MRIETDALAVGLEESPRRVSKLFRKRLEEQPLVDSASYPWLLEENLNLKSVEMHVDSAPDISDRDWRHWLERASQYSVDGKYHLSVALLKRVVKRVPKHAEAWHQLGFAFEQLNRREEAVDCYSRTLRLAPRWAEAWNNRGINYLKLKKTIEAIHDFEQAVILSPDSALFWTNLASAQARFSSSDRASTSFERACELDPKNDLIWLKRGRYLIKRGDREEAHNCFRHCCVINPSNLGAWTGLFVGTSFLTNLPKFETIQFRQAQVNRPEGTSLVNVGQVIPSDRYLANK